MTPYQIPYGCQSIEQDDIDSFASVFWEHFTQLVVRLATDPTRCKSALKFGTG